MSKLDVITSTKYHVIVVLSSFVVAIVCVLTQTYWLCGLSLGSAIAQGLFWTYYKFNGKDS